ncbi:MAG: hypothetical protein IKY52_05815 [Clostridia bacterium]|nr:hypothetical protein [Clostridia bacterium]
MRTIYDGYTLLDTEEAAFFAGANTGSGFAGEFEHFADEEKLNHLWIIKGASGSGKSTLMRKICADALSDGHSYIQYLCSSDPDSLDAAVVDGKYAILDGTSPHIWEMEYPGAVSELIYLGKYWKPELLEAEKETVFRLTGAKKEAFRAGYAYLNAVSVLEKEQFQSAMYILHTEKVNAWIDRLLGKIPGKSRTGETEWYRTWAVTAKGLFRTNGLQRMAGHHWTISDRYQTAVCLLGMFAERCRKLQIPVCLSAHPIHDRITEVYIPSMDLHIALGDEPSDKTICMSRFLQKELLTVKKGTIRLSARCMVSLLEDSCLCFREAGRVHAELEKVYGKAMDFSAMNRETGQLRKRISKTISLT